jgi:hypothetical protein
MAIDEEKLSKIYQQGKGQGPSAQLDKAILEAAHAAVQQDKSDAVQQSEVTAERGKVRGPFSGGWPAMASIAALLLITVVLVPLIEQEAPPEALDYIDGTADRLKEKQVDADSVNKSEELPAVLKAKARSQTERHSSKPSQPGTQLPGTQLSEPLQSGALNETATSQKKNLSRQPLAAGETKRLKQPTVGGYTSQLLKPVPTAVMQSEQTVSDQVASGQAASKKAMNDEREPEIRPDADYKQEVSSTADTAMQEIKETALVEQADKWLQEIRELIENGNFIEARDELEQFKQYYPDEEIDAEISTLIKEFFQDE